MFFIFILFLLSIAGVTASSFMCRKKSIPEKYAFYTSAGSIALQLLSVFLSVISGHNLVTASVLILIADILIALPCMALYRINNALSPVISSRQKLIRGLTVGTAVVLIFEVFICNFGTYSLMLPNAPNEQTFSMDNLRVESEQSKSFSIQDINSEVQTIYVDIELDNAVQNTISIANNDETSQALRSVTSLNYINGNESSKYVLCSYFGKVNELQFNINADKDSGITINSITINKVIPFQFSFTRFITILIMVLFLVILAYSPIMKKEVGSSKALGFSTVVVTAVFMLIGLSLFLIRDNVFEFFKNPDLNQINKELVDAFRAGQVSLLQEPSEELLALSNPYDNSLRSESGVYYLWDHLLYDGKFYSYYGIGSVLTLFLPYNLITDNYFPSLWATLIYSEIGILFLSLAYFTFVKRLFPKITNGIAVSGLVIVQSSSFVWYCITIGNFYELAQVSGFAFLIAGTFFLLRSGVFGKEKISRINICISTTLLAISVLCRAALALYCIVSLIFIYAGVKKIINTSEIKKFRANIKPVITFLLAAMIPFVLIGSVQMAYNYLRFGSVLDFGISYTLTIYDYQHIQFHLPLTFIAIYNYIFTLPKLNAAFPFITSNYESLSVNGYYFLAGFSSAGLIFRAFPVLGYVFGGRAYRNSGSNRKIAAVIIILGCLVVPFIQMALIWEYGYTPRYAVDFAWQMIFGAMAILFVYHRVASKPVKRLLYGGFAVSAVVSFIINMALTYEFVLYNANTLDILSKETISDMVSFGRLFEFWNIM